MWLSEGLQQTRHLDGNCLRAAAARRETSHDHLFHTLLDLLDVETAAYDPAWDVLGDCQAG